MAWGVRKTDSPKSDPFLKFVTFVITSVSVNVTEYVPSVRKTAVQTYSSVERLLE